MAQKKNPDRSRFKLVTAFIFFTPVKIRGASYFFSLPKRLWFQEGVDNFERKSFNMNFPQVVFKLKAFCAQASITKKNYGCSHLAINDAQK